MSDYYSKLERAKEDELKLRDSDGCIFWLDSFDSNGVYYHADEGDTYFLGHPRFKKEMEFVEA